MFLLVIGVSVSINVSASTNVNITIKIGFNHVIRQVPKFLSTRDT